MSDKWRMTLDELTYAAKVNPSVLERWARLGAYGPRWKEPRDRGKYRHISREMAQRAVIMSRLLRAGLTEHAAADIAATHVTNDEEPLFVILDDVTITVARSDLP